MNPSIVIACKNRSEHHLRWCSAFDSGLKRHGIVATWTDDVTMMHADLVVFWSHRMAMHIAAQRQHGADYLTIECGYMGDRVNQWASLGFNGLNGDAEYVDHEGRQDRWQQWQHLMKPWKKGGDYWLIAGQVPGDESLQGLNIVNWCYKQQQAVKEYDPVRPAVIRWHPLSRQGGRQPDLEEHLANAFAVVSYSSNLAVDAILAGVPVVSKGARSMVKEVAATRLNGLVRPCREAWARKLSYCQWSIDEIREGIAWEHLRQRYR